MKERTRELAEQAGWMMGDEVEGFNTRLEKFALLIVKEMLQTCEDHPAWTGRMIGNQIREHFGVEL